MCTRATQTVNGGEQLLGLINELIVRVDVLRARMPGRSQFASNCRAQLGAISTDRIDDSTFLMHIWRVEHKPVAVLHVCHKELRVNLLCNLQQLVLGENP